MFCFFVLFFLFVFLNPNRFMFLLVVSDQILDAVHCLQATHEYPANQAPSVWFGLVVAPRTSRLERLPSKVTALPCAS